MKTNKQYNGFDNWNTRNVVLWINNDYGLYCEFLKTVEALGKTAAGKNLYSRFKGSRTPDGARYTLKAIKLAIADYCSLTGNNHA